MNYTVNHFAPHAVDLSSVVTTLIGFSLNASIYSVRYSRKLDFRKNELFAEKNGRTQLSLAFIWRFV